MITQKEVMFDSVLDSLQKEDSPPEIDMLHYQQPEPLHMNNPFLCPICLEVLLCPITTSCGHSFCDQCLSEYFLFCEECPCCKHNIRDKKTIFNLTLNELVATFVQSSGDSSEHKHRKQLYHQWLGAKRVKEVEAGVRLDIRDRNHVWCRGVVTRLINRYSEPKKYVKVKIERWNGDIGEDLDPRSPRLAPLGFFSSRRDIPRYVERREGEWCTRMLVMEEPRESNQFVILKQFQTVEKSD